MSGRIIFMRIENMATKEQILTKLKEKLSYRLSPEEVKPKKGYIWVGGQNGLIGNITCHYEFIFYTNLV